MGLLALAGVLSHRGVSSELFRRADHTAVILTEHALRTFRAQELVISFVDAYADGLSWAQIRSSRRLHRLLQEVAKGNSDIAAVFLIDPEGRVALSSRDFPAPPVDASDRDYYRALRDQAGLYVSERAIGRITQEPFFNVAARRSSPADRFDGLITVSVNPEYYESFYRSFLGPQEVANLVRDDGVVLARHPRVPEDRQILPTTAPLMQRLSARDAQGRLVGRSFIDGVHRMVAYRQVGALPVYATFQAPTAMIWAEWWRLMVPYVLASALALAGLLAAIRLAEQRARSALAEQRHRDATEANRTKDLFIATVSHEIRNPLAAIAVASHLLRRGEPYVAKASEVISRQVEHVGAILDDLLDTARAVYGKLKLQKRPLDLYAAAQEMVADRAMERRKDLRISLDGETAWVHADPVRLRQMIENLLENAVRYGGRNIRIVVRPAPECSELIVQDDGQGIAPELLPRLFEPFVQGEQALDRRQGGLGLGLALIGRLAQLHGGTVSASSAGVGRGSAFTLRLPRAAPAPPASAGARHEAGREERRRILVVEDNDDERELLRSLLEDAGHEVTVAATGPDGLAAFIEADPDIALLDIGLPGMDGYELARRARALRPDRPALLIAISGYGSARDERQASLAGFDAHLRKPFSPAALLRLLRSSM
jgi:signal transduction histidine kinase/CheY-like chemotaxis protein